MTPVHFLTAGLGLASALFVAIMLVAPPISDAATTGNDRSRDAEPLELVGP